MSQGEPKVRCGGCNRVLDAHPRSRTLTRVEKQAVEELPYYSAKVAKVGELLGVAHPKAPHYRGWLTVTRGVVTSVCRCGANGTMPYDDFERGYFAARERDEDYLLPFGASARYGRRGNRYS